MGSTQGPSQRARQGSDGGRVEEDGGESSEHTRARDNQKKKGKIGRPPNRPPPPPREIPIQIVPRPEPADGQPHSRHRLRTGPASHTDISRTTIHRTQASANATQNERPPSRPGRSRPPRKLTEHLQEGEYLTPVTFLTPDGKVWAKVPNALVSPHWSRSYISPEAVDVMGYCPMNLTEAELHTSVTPRGQNRDDKAVGVWMKLEEMESPEDLLVRLPVLNKRGLGVSMVIGKPLIEALCRPTDWYPSNDTQYVHTDQVATMPIYGMNHESWSYNYSNVDGEAEIDASMDPNVYLGTDSTINYDLMAVGTGVSVDYAEMFPGVTSWDGYLQEN